MVCGGYYVRRPSRFAARSHCTVRFLFECGVRITAIARNSRFNWAATRMPARGASSMGWKEMLRLRRLAVVGAVTTLAVAWAGWDQASAKARHQSHPRQQARAVQPRA